MSARQRSRRKAPPDRRSTPAEIAPTTRTDDNEDRTSLGLAGAIGLAAATLYALTAARDIVLGDSAEFVTVAATLGVSHPPGYPLFALLGHAMTWLPTGPIPFRVNLVSALAGAGTVVVVFLIGLRLTRDRLAAALAAVLLAVHPLVWEWSLAAEVFTLNAFLASVVIYALIRWDARPEDGRWFVVAAGAGALGTANHHTIVFLLPAALFLVWRHRGALINRPRMAAWAAAVALLALSTYLYIPWAAARRPLVSWGDVSSASELLQHFLRSTYGTFQLTSSEAARASGTYADRLGVFFGSSSIAEVILVPLGAVAAFQRARRAFWLIASAWILGGPFFTWLAELDTNTRGYAWVLQRFFVLPHAVAAPLQAFGVVAVTAGLSRILPRRRAVWARVAIVLAVLGLSASIVAAEFQRLDQRGNHLARTYAEDILATMPPNAVLLAGGDEVVLPVAYLQAVEGLRPDVTLVMFGPLSRGDWYIRELRARDPRLVIPFDRYDPAGDRSTIRAMVDANPTRPFAWVGKPLDTSIDANYWLLPRGLALTVQPLTVDVPLAAMAAENERLLRMYRIPPAELANRPNFDPYVLRAYASAATHVALQFAGAQEPTAAAAWLRRALNIDPTDVFARDLLSDVQKQ